MGMEVQRRRKDHAQHDRAPADFALAQDGLIHALHKQKLLRLARGVKAGGLSLQEQDVAAGKAHVAQPAHKLAPLALHAT